MYLSATDGHAAAAEKLGQADVFGHADDVEQPKCRTRRRRAALAALDMETQEALYPGDIGKQAEVTYGSIVHLLDYAGLGPADLVTTIEFCVESALRDYRAVAPVRERLLSPPWPASTGAICKGLLRPEFLLEVFPTALYPEGAPTTKAQKAGSGNTGSQTAGDAS